MGRWRRRNPELPREERQRLAAAARAFFLEIARERSWLPFWEFDDPDYKECLFFPGNPGVRELLTFVFACDAVSLGEPDCEWFGLDEAGRAGFRGAIDAWLGAQDDQAPSHSRPPGSSSAL